MTQLCGAAAHAASSSSAASLPTHISHSDVDFMTDVLDIKLPVPRHSLLSSPPMLQGPERSRVLEISRKSTSSSSSASSTHPTSPLSAASSPPPLSMMNPSMAVPSMTTTMTSYPGMKDVPAWLKLLRLHKYTPMFMRLSYEEMMMLDENRLEQLGVTKGARKKILQSVSKLNDRANDLSILVNEMNGICPNLRQTIHDLRLLLGTPIVAYRPMASEAPNLVEGACPNVRISDINLHNLPGRFCNVAARLHERIVLQERFIDVDDESVAKLHQIYDRIASHEAFTSRQADYAAHWRKALRTLAMERGMNGAHAGHHYIKRSAPAGTTNGFSAGLHRYGSRVSPHGTRSYAIGDASKSTTSPPQSSSAPPSLPGGSVADINFSLVQKDPEGAILIGKMINLSIKLDNKQSTLPLVDRDRRTIVKSLSSPDNSNLNQPLTPQEKQAFLDDESWRNKILNEDFVIRLPSYCDTPMNVPSSSTATTNSARFFSTASTHQAPQPLMTQRSDRWNTPITKPHTATYSMPPPSAPDTTTNQSYPTTHFSPQYSWRHHTHHYHQQQQQHQHHNHHPMTHRHHSQYAPPHQHHYSTVLNSQNMPPVN